MIRTVLAVLLAALALPATAHAVVGGAQTSTKDAPWVVMLVDAKNQQYTFCGGTLVAPTKVVTAAHCVDTESPSSVKIVAGRDNPTAKNGVVADVVKIWYHPQFNVNNSKRNDIAVLTLRQKLTQKTLPLGAPASSGTIYGWGGTSGEGGQFPVLRKATAPVQPDATCRAHPEYFAQTMFCAGKSDGTAVSCYGDSGGPFVANGRLVGVVSFGPDGACGQPKFPTVYTRVSAFTSVLQKEIQG